MKKIIPIIAFFGSFHLNAQTFQWAESFSGSGTEKSNAIVVDGSGNVYTAGLLMGVADFDPGPGTFTLSAPGGGGFISKIDASGNFIWAKCITASGGSYINAIALDLSGNVITTGGFQNTIDLDPGTGADYHTATSGHDVFVSKLDGSGNFVWGKTFGGTGIEWGDGLAVDASNDIYVSGNFNSNNMDFDPSAATYSATASGGPDAFISKLTSAGNFVFAKNFGGTGSDYGKGIKVDAAMNIYITGYYDNTADFDPSSSASFTIAAAGSSDSYVSKLDATGNFVWAKSMGGASSDYGYAIELDPTGNVLTTGAFQGTGDFDPGVGTYSLNFSGVYVSKLDNAGNFVWAAKLGGAYGYAITTDAAGNVYTTGNYNIGGDFDPGTGIMNLSTQGFNDVFISELDPSGNYLWAASMGGSGDDKAYAINVNGTSVHVAGYYNGTGDFDPTPGSFTLSPVGGYDAFVVKFNFSPTGIHEIISTNESVSIYPNPSNGLFNIVSSAQFTEIKIYNQFGSHIATKESEGLTTNIDISNVALGIYFYQVVNKGEIIKTGKLIVK